MKRISRIGIVIIIDSVVAVLILAMVVFMSCFVSANGTVYPRNIQELDLTGKQLSAAEYEIVHEKLPDSRILWMVPLESGSVRSDATQITVTSLSDADIVLMDYLADLQTVFAQDCPDSVQLAILQQRRPHIQVHYSVHIAGEKYSPDAASVSVIGMTEKDIPALSAFRNLSELTIAGGTELSLVSQIQAEHPQLDVKYIVTIGNTSYPGETQDLVLESAEYDHIVQALELLPELSTLSLTNPKASGIQLTALRDAFPETQIHWQVDAYGMRFDDETVQMDVSGISIDSLETLAGYADCLPKLDKLILGECGIDNETLAAFRESRRDSYKVVWTIRFTKKLAAPTDSTTFMPSHDDIREYRFNESLGVNVQDLKYFEDMVCMDLGHFIIYKIDFASYMPHLKYLILSWTEVHDLSPLVNCQELMYLELDYSQVRDFSPLVECKALEDLNICGTIADVTPLTQITWLKNLWADNRSYASKCILFEAFPQEDEIGEDGEILVTKSDTYVYTLGDSTRAWRHLPHYYEMRDMLGMYYMNQ